MPEGQAEAWAGSPAMGRTLESLLWGCGGGDSRYPVHNRPNALWTMLLSESQAPLPQVSPSVHSVPATMIGALW